MSHRYPVLPLKNTVVFPQLVAPLAVGRPASLAAIRAAMTADGRLVCIAQRNGDLDDPAPEDLYAVGTVVAVKRVEAADAGSQVLVQGVSRVRIEAVETVDDHLVATVTELPEVQGEGDAFEAGVRANLDIGREIALLFDSDNGATVFAQLVGSIRDPILQQYRMASLANLDVAREQDVLEADDAATLLERMRGILRHEAVVVRLRREIADQARGELEKTQRDHLLRQQKQVIEQALGESGGGGGDAAELRARIEALELPEVARTEAERELRRLERLPTQAADYQLVRAWLELVAELPWTKLVDPAFDLDRAAAVLDEDHFGLADVKDRILEHLAVMKMNPAARAPILCFVGPPGVGKTSVGQSIARALGRPFERLALGGMHDEAELRGHRRTYVGAMPGRLLQALRRAGARNPLLMLDEIDKLGRDFRGDPAAALMEVLDPAQNDAFRDNYLNLPFDLSRVFFITTANTLDGIPRPLLDRMEVIRLPGYSDAEKVEIARRYLLPRQRREAGLDAARFDVTDAALTTLITRYTREAGVRELERSIAALARKVVRGLLGSEQPATIDADAVTARLGAPRFFPEDEARELPAGVAAGLAWTEAGGEVLYVEASRLPREDKIVLTGQLGDVMQESVRAARSWIWNHAAALGIDPAQITDHGLHVHVPAGAVPKDGPSAGVTMVTALVSLFSGRQVRPRLAMTGEITLSGLVLPVGGIREKVLAAHRNGITTLVLPKANRHDIDKLPDNVREQIAFHFAERIDEVIGLAF